MDIKNLEDIKYIIDERVNEWLHDNAVDLNPEDPLVNDKWISETEAYITNKEPGWELLKEWMD